MTWRGINAIDEVGVGDEGFHDKRFYHNIFDRLKLDSLVSLNVANWNERPFKIKVW